MWRRFLLVAACLSFPAAALAHLCNDVFIQARDNLAVKVDVRDGQLRIGQQASFRVYLLNTMDRDIVNIKLEVRTNNKFQATVKPAPAWRRCPYLKCVRKSGSKQYYEVTLQRKPGVPDGKYRIDLHLFNGRNKSMVFKTVNLDDAAALREVPKAAGVKVDGNASSTEWGKSLMCTGFHAYQKKGRYFVNVPAQEQGRFRLSADATNLYACLGFQGGGGAESDVATLYLAPALDATPVKVGVDRLTGKVTCDKGSAGLECKVSGNKSVVELKIPRNLVGLTGAKSFYGNFTRTVKLGGKELVTYWRGNKYSVNNPVEYANFKFAE